jgi:putative PIN family toxin of toxin-antitoxin system
MADRPRATAVFDCNVFAQALININGPAGVAVRAALAGSIRLVLSNHVLREAAELPSKLPRRLGVTEDRVNELLSQLLQSAEQIATPPPVFAFDRDPDDAAYVDLAVASGATYLVTRDKDLLSLSVPNATQAVAFAARFPGLRVVDPVAFLAVLSDVQP